MALIALDGTVGDRLAGPAIARGADLLGRGPARNILLIRADRGRIFLPMLSRGVLVIAAPQSWCGAGKDPS
ncbi:hypothetical protein [Sphingomonas sp.]|uniref:hypothetical protein n=1 Tax=Sphingomonas sp. TaxID=28214 RepID=UPI001EBD79BA|nr:hypothetical protein [Sphingomonas sp.]MBX3595652.1 hypothetical protein [Sphingomonas sp.]